MDVIDEDGRLFGLVNVIDALVVLLVLAVVIAGVALVNPFSAGEETTMESQYATLELGEQPRYVAEQITSGDVMRPDGGSNVTVTDVYVGPGNEENASVIVRTRINGTLQGEDGSEQAFTYGGDRLRQGARFTLTTGAYTANGTITRLSANGTTLETETREVRVESEVTPSTARRIEVGDSVTIANRTVATIEDVHVGPGSDASSRSVTAGLSVDAIRRSNGFSFGGQGLSIGRTLTLDFSEYALSGEIEALGGEAASVRTEETGVTLAATVSDGVAERIETGDTYRVANETLATIEQVRQYPGPNDNRRQLYLGVTLTGTLKDDERYFGPDRLSIGASVPFRAGEYDFTGTVESLNGATVETTTTQVALETTVSTTVAGAIAVGDTFDVSGDTVATVQSLDVYPTGNDATRRVLLGLDLRTVERESGQYFGTRAVTLGATIPFETTAYGLSGTVVGQGSYVPAGSVETRTITLQVENVSPDFADGIETGMTERNLERTTARILEKGVEPASVILTSEDGEIYERTHPRNKDVTLTVEVVVRETDDGYRFHARSLKEGDTITLDFRTIDVSGTMTDIR